MANSESMDDYVYAFILLFNLEILLPLHVIQIPMAKAMRCFDNAPLVAHHTHTHHLHQHVFPPCFPLCVMLEPSLALIAIVAA